MKLGPTPVAEAVDAVLVHTLRVGTRTLKKGRVLTDSDVEALAQAGHVSIYCARIEADEVDEDAAATAVAAVLVGDGVSVEPAHTGRVNVFAEAAGLARFDTSMIERVNRVDESITVATLAADVPVRAGEMVATIKIIPFAVPRATVEQIAAMAAAAIRVLAWRPCRAGLILTAHASTAGALLDRAEAAQRERVTRIGGELARVVRVAHDRDAIAAAMQAMVAAGLDPILCLGASAIMDRRDVIPSAIESCGGAVHRFGMPVDPGNLMLLASVPTAGRDVHVLGVPGCARSLKRSGFDWVLERLAAGAPVSCDEVAGRGVGGLLDEIAARPAQRAQPPASESRPRRVAAIVLAAGRGTRMGGDKLVAALDGKPLVRWAVEAAVASRASPVVVVTGHAAERVRSALDGLEVDFVHNPDFAEGMSTSLRAGLRHVEGSDGALICLGDMPRVSATQLDRLIAAFDPAADADIVVPTSNHKRGNPILWSRAHFAAMSALEGDVGARALLEEHADQIRLVPVDDDAVLVDVDTPQALAEVGRTTSPRPPWP